MSARGRAWALAVALLALPLAQARAAGQGEPRLSQIEQAIETYTRALETAERDLRLEEFRRAERLFARVAEEGTRSAELYANLGNAALQAERIGPAVLAYRRALLVDPDGRRALQNLEHVRALLPEWVPHAESESLLDSFFFWHRTLSRAERARAGAFCFAAAGLLLAAAIRFRQTPLRNAALLPALAWIALVASLALDPAAQVRDEAVVTAGEAVARAADSSLAPVAFPAPLPGGTEVRILERRSPWLRIRLANGRDAWVAESSVTRVALD
jgi:tetratricopeptide (TPR) repeat protein